MFNGLINQVTTDKDKKMNESPSRIEVAAVAYLALPVILFFATFAKLWIGIPAVLFLLYSVGTLMRRSVKPPGIPLIHWIYIALMALGVMTIGGYGRFFPENSDWIKHYALVNELVSHSWPVIEAGQVMRYALGWYLVPAAAMKFLGGQPNIYLSIWTLVGLLLVLRLNADLFPGKIYAVLAPLVFFAFSGADIIGQRVTKFHAGPLYHLEWWSGWGEYPSTITSLFWTPQHALPAWLLTLLLMRQWNLGTMLGSLPTLFFVTCLWSPFAAIGTAPFFLVVLARHGYRTFFDWRVAGAVVLIGVPLALYLTAGSSGIPYGFASDVSCSRTAIQCFSPSTYLLFIQVEFVYFAAVLFFIQSEQRGILAIASICLLIYPLVYFGIRNDLMMRASIAPLAVLALLTAKAATTRGWIPRAILAVLLGLGAITPLGEMRRPFDPRMQPASQAATLDEATEHKAGLRAQYFAPHSMIVKSR